MLCNQADSSMTQLKLKRLLPCSVNGERVSDLDDTEENLPLKGTEGVGRGGGVVLRVGVRQGAVMRKRVKNDNESRRRWGFEQEQIWAKCFAEGGVGGRGWGD